MLVRGHPIAERRLVKLDVGNTWPGVADLAYGRTIWHEEAIAHFQRALELDAAADVPLYHLSAEYAHLDMFDESVNAKVRFWGDRGEGEEADLLRRVYREKGYHLAIAAVADKYVEWASQEYVSPELIAEYYALAGETEHALLWPEKAYEERDPALWTIRGNNYFNSIRSEPRFKELERRIGLPD